MGYQSVCDYQKETLATDLHGWRGYPVHAPKRKTPHGDAGRAALSLHVCLVAGACNYRYRHSLQVTV